MAGDEKPPANNPFASLKDALGPLPAGPAKPVSPEPKPPAPKGPARAVVRLERKGRAGKEVTVVEKLDLRAAELDRWLKDLKSSLGCGGVIEDGAIVLQGDHRDRTAALLSKRGVVKVILGS